LNHKKIVITGGPGTGKTSIINELKQRNYHCFDEIIRSLTIEAKEGNEASSHISNPIAFVNNPLDFNTRLLNGRVNQFKQSINVQEPLIFFDRGIPDVLAYMSFFNQDYNDTFLNICQNYRYNEIFLLPPWKAIYKSDNERFESFEEAVKIHDYLEAIYKNLGYHIVEVPLGTVQERTQFIVNSL
jgi:predicted ATPase